MFQHSGSERTYRHNLQIASLLSFVAGIVNIAGFLSVQRLTTNVTGHFAYFVDEVVQLRPWFAFIFILFIFSFFLGSFTSGLLIEIISRRLLRLTYVIPAIIESLLLFSIAFCGSAVAANNPDAIACVLLFAMGLQNSLVTNISRSVVRTTHLTGLFTDLGIELSQLFFYRQSDQRKKLLSSVKLRLTIIFCFFFGGLLGGIFYSRLGLQILAIAAIVLTAGALLDISRLKDLMRSRGKHISESEK